MKDIKVKKVSNKKQGETASTGQLPEGRDSFAYAVGELIEKSKSMSGSSNGFLGVEKETLDPNLYVQKDKLPTKKGKK